jgi:hypothetical protein
MTYAEELKAKYQAVKDRMYKTSRVSIVDQAAVVAAQEALWRANGGFEALSPPISFAGVAGPSGLVPPQSSVQSGFTPLAGERQSYHNMLRMVARKHNINPNLIQSDCRKRPLIAARHELWYRVRTELDYSYPRIAQLAGRDHSTVFHGIQKHGRKILDSQSAQVQSERAM